MAGFCRSLVAVLAFAHGLVGCSDDESTSSSGGGAGTSGTSAGAGGGGSGGTGNPNDAGQDVGVEAAAGSSGGDSAAPISWLAAKVDGNSQSSFLTNKDTFETWLGRKMDAFVGFTAVDHWTNSSGEFIAMSYSKGIYAPLNVPVIWQIGLCPNDDSTTNYLVQVAAGAHDSEFETAAKSLATFRPEDAAVYIRVGHEFNGTWYSWGQKTINGVPNANGVQPSDFVNAFRRVVDIFRSVESQRFRFVWNPALRLGKAAGTYAESFYPGDDYVDVISFDIYWDKPTNSDPAKFFEVARDAPAGLKWHAEFATSRGKPIAFDEWGANDDGGPFVDAMATWFVEHEPLWHGYWDSDSGYQGKISNGQSGTTGERYKANFGP
jgi:hypothetical protein